MLGRCSLTCRERTGLGNRVRGKILLALCALALLACSGCSLGSGIDLPSAGTFDSEADSPEAFGDGDGGTLDSGGEKPNLGVDDGTGGTDGAGGSGLTGGWGGGDCFPGGAAGQTHACSPLDE